MKCFIKITLLFLLFNNYSSAVCGARYQLYHTDSCRYYLHDLGFRLPEGKDMYRFPWNHASYANVVIDKKGVGFPVLFSFQKWMEWVRKNMAEKYPNKVVRLTYTKFGGADIELNKRRQVYYIFIDDKELKEHE